MGQLMRECKPLNILPPGKNFPTFLSSAVFFKINFSKNSFRNIIRLSVGPDLGPNYLQKLSADDARIELNNGASKFGDFKRLI